jgi:UrcA family protein
MDFNTPLSRRICAVLAAAGFATAAVPAFAQEVDEITVMGRMGPDGQPHSLSRPVSIADLDLRSDADVSVMRTRIRNTARQLCNELGESDSATLRPSCRDAAVRDALGQARLAVAQARSAPAYAFLEPEPYLAPAAADYAPPASAEVPEATYTTTTVTNGPVPDTPENRARLGGPMSNGGAKTAPVGN